MTDTMPRVEPGNARSLVADSFAEAFPMTAARVIITANTPAWAAVAADTMTGYATSEPCLWASLAVTGEVTGNCSTVAC